MDDWERQVELVSHFSTLFIQSVGENAATSWLCVFPIVHFYWFVRRKGGNDSDASTVPAGRCCGAGVFRSESR